MIFSDSYSATYTINSVIFPSPAENLTSCLVITFSLKVNRIGEWYDVGAHSASPICIKFIAKFFEMKKSGMLPMFVGH